MCYKVDADELLLTTQTESYCQYYVTEKFIA